MTEARAPAPEDSAPKVSDPKVEGKDVDTASIMNALRGVIDPELGDNVVDLGMVKRLERSADRAIHITIALTTAGCPLRAQLMRDAKARVGSLPDIEVVKIHFGEMTADERSNVMARARWKARDNALETDIPPTCRILGICENPVLQRVLVAVEEVLRGGGEAQHLGRWVQCPQQRQCLLGLTIRDRLRVLQPNDPLATMRAVNWSLMTC